jgi:hypothetical protein
MEPKATLTRSGPPAEHGGVHRSIAQGSELVVAITKRGPSTPTDGVGASWYPDPALDD